MSTYYDGQEVVEWCAYNLLSQGRISPQDVDLVKRNTKITYATMCESGGIQFRFETDVNGAHPVCQYVTITNGVMYFRNESQWFTPGDVLFNTFDEAKEYSRSITLPLKRGNNLLLGGEIKIKGGFFNS